MHRSSFQESIIESIPPNAEKLFFSNTDFSRIKWIEKSKEFEFGDKLYDVSKIEIINKGFQVYCVNDGFEESFIAMFDQWKRNNSPNGKVKTIFQPQFCNRIDLENIVRDDISQIEFFFVTNFYISQAEQAPSPPPKFI